MNKLILWIIGTLVIIAGGFFVWEKAQDPAAVTQSDMIRVTVPATGAIVVSPLTVIGEARGTWYFEASFPIELLDADSNQIVAVPAHAQGEWMTENFVPFTATLNFTPPATDTGFLVLKKDNPSGLPEHDEQVEIPVWFR